MKRHSQSGITLVVSLIMLVVLTLLVVSAIRFSNINLKIASNAQFDAEASAASVAALEQMLVKMAEDGVNVDTVPAQNIAVSTGATTHTVSLVKPHCVLSRNITTKDLDWEKNPEDQKCYEGTPGDLPIGGDGMPIAQPTACKDQQWDVVSSLEDKSSAAKVDMVQGVAMRVGAEVLCP